MKFIQLRGKDSNKFVIVDDEDYEYLCKLKLYACTNGLIYINFRYGKKVLLHRYLMKPNNSDIKIDHIDRNRLNNQKSNLRMCSNQENCRNQHKRKGNYSSKFKNVIWEKRSKKWRAYIVVDNKQKHIGLFNNEIEAAEHADFYAIKLFGEFACLNFPNKNYDNFQDKIKRRK